MRGEHLPTPTAHARARSASVTRRRMNAVDAARLQRTGEHAALADPLEVLAHLERDAERGVEVVDRVEREQARAQVIVSPTPGTL